MPVRASRGDAPEGNYIPGAPETVLSAGVAIQQFGPWSGALFLRYIGPYPLTEDNSVRAKSSTVVDGQIGFRLSPRGQLRFDGFNLFDAKANDITYYYASRLPGEPSGGVDDVHFHPAEPRSFRSR